MIGIQSFMFLALGVLVAGAFVLAILPFYRRRAERLTLDRVKRSMPLTEAEIRADKDRLRADYAILIHELESRVEDAGQSAARQKVELNRRDAAISALEAENGTLRTKLDEHENARRVLEQSIMDRLPKVEQRLAGAKKLLYERDREIVMLTSSAEKQAAALDEAMQINRQQREENERLSGTLSTRAARNRRGLDDPRFDGEVALRSEIEALRAKTRDQAALIDRLQSASMKRDGAGGVKRGVGALLGTTGRDASAPDLVSLQRQLADAEARANAANSGTSERDVRSLKAKVEDQATRIAELEGELGAFRKTEHDAKSLTDTKMAMKAELTRLEVQNTKQGETIEQLRAEVAGAQERLAKQAAHFMSEMRRFGAGTLPVADGSSGVVATNVDLSAMSSTNKAQHPKASEQELKPSLVDRISAPRTTTKERPDLMTALAQSGIGPRVVGDAKTAGAGSDGMTPPAIVPVSANDTPADEKVELSEKAPPTADQAASGVAPEKAPRRSGLLDRITRLDKDKVPSKTA